MRQLLLDLLPPPPAPTFDNFVVGRNAPLLASLQAIMSDVAGTERIHYLWGESGCGKTHLLHALQQQHPSQWLDRLAPLEAFVPDTAPDAACIYLVDDVTQLNPAQQDALFALYNCINESIRNQQQPVMRLVMSGPCAPFQLNEASAFVPRTSATANMREDRANMREDLRSRIGAAMVWQIQALSDGEMAEALSQAAQARGLQLHPGIVPWLLTHWERSMPALMALLDALDRYSLERRRAAITLPLLRDLLSQTA